MLVIIVLKLKFASGQFQVCFFCSFLQEKKPSKNSWGEHRVAATLLLEVRHCFTKSVPLKCGSAMHLRAKNLPPYSSSFTMHYVYGYLSGAPRSSVFHVVSVENFSGVKYECSACDRSHNPTHTTRAVGQPPWVGSQGSPSWRLCRWWTAASGGHCLPRLWMQHPFTVCLAVLEQLRWLFSAEQGANTWLS